MKETLFKTLKLVFAFAVCSTIGTPQSAFTSVQHFMLNEHIYEDRCTVSSSMILTDTVYCLESRSAYVNVYGTAGLGLALAVLPAYYSSKYFGFFFTNICCCLALAAGSVIISDRPEDQWVTDRFQYGYAVVAMAAPFAIINLITTISDFSTSRIGKLTLFLAFLAFTQLGPFLWTAFTWQFSDSILQVRELFKNLLWVPCIWLFATLVLMLLSDSAEESPGDIDDLLQLLKCHFGLSSEKEFPSDTLEIADNSSETLGVLSIAKDDDLYNDCAYSSYFGVLFSRPYISLLLSYVINTVPIDLILVSGEARMNDELGLSSELTIWSPIIAMCVTPLIFWLTSAIGIKTVHIIVHILCIGLTIAQVVSTGRSWVFASFLVGTCQVFLIWVTSISFIKCVPFKEANLTGVTFLIISAVIKSLVLPSTDAAVEFGESVIGCNPYKILLMLQVLTLLYSWYVLSKESQRESRLSLELEARIAFAAEV